MKKYTNIKKNEETKKFTTREMETMKQTNKNICRCENADLG